MNTRIFTFKYNSHTASVLLGAVIVVALASISVYNAVSARADAGSELAVAAGGTSEAPATEVSVGSEMHGTSAVAETTSADSTTPLSDDGAESASLGTEPLMADSISGVIEEEDDADEDDIHAEGGDDWNGWGEDGEEEDD